VAARDDGGGGGGADGGARGALRAVARVVTAATPDELRAALRAMSAQGAEPQRGLVHYARRRLAWLEQRRRGGRGSGRG
jgi:hypothetical protein